MYTINEISTRLNVSDGVIYRLIKKNGIVGTKVISKNRYYYTAEQMDLIDGIYNNNIYVPMVIHHNTIYHIYESKLNYEH